MNGRELEKLRMSAGTCIVCGMTFNELHNIGSWACAQHAESPIRGIYPCCGIQHRASSHRFRRGCVLADHNSKDLGTSDMPPPWTRWHDVTLPDEAIRKMPRVRPEAVIQSSADGFFCAVRIRRFQDPNLAIYFQTIHG